MMQTTPTLSIDLPLRALVWQDDNDGVWLTYNSVDFLTTEFCVRHGVNMSLEARQKMDLFLKQVSRMATE